MKGSKIFVVKQYKLPSTPTKYDQNSTQINKSKEMKMNTVQLNLPFDCKYMSSRGEVIKSSEKDLKRDHAVNKELKPIGNVFPCLTLSIDSQNKISQPKFSNQNLAKFQMANEEKNSTSHQSARNPHQKGSKYNVSEINLNELLDSIINNHSK